VLSSEGLAGSEYNFLAWAAAQVLLRQQALDERRWGWNGRLPLLRIEPL